jgi:hypothetical protein
LAGNWSMTVNQRRIGRVDGRGCFGFAGGGLAAGGGVLSIFFFDRFSNPWWNDVRVRHQTIVMENIVWIEQGNVSWSDNLVVGGLLAARR